ncbi:hypothetical protein BJP34_04195 [Moorena producens PAL-8-15-08-1]|uniref:Uncharacterized protein n=1 Tax=Moorena producens PAL-8-15-08-1 TaxID=1458985 RepID=A0A1D8TMX6_9CYAN|nr:hypothetical protein BJP34_04195 [Moorena producens PAL-8-15-08-1]
MKHQPFLHWMHRWSRPLIAGIASLGAVATAYPKIIHRTYAFAPVGPPILGDFDIITPQNWGARGAKST